MSNSGLIVAHHNQDGPAIYLHWNGGPEPVLAFVAAAKELGFRDPTHDHGFAYLQSLIGLYFGDGLSTSLGCAGYSPQTDHGPYVLTPGFRMYTVEETSAMPKELLLYDLSDEDVTTFHRIKTRAILRWLAGTSVGDPE